jgi:dTDP-4-dehydrorhamnose reductase
MRIFTLGKGLIASHLPYPKITDRIETVHDIDKIIEKYKPDVLVNGIGFCGTPNVDECENRKTDTYTANVTIPSLLARRAEHHNFHLVHFGSGCIFFGSSPRCEIQYGERTTVTDLGWKEDDHANPQSHYSKTKYACDLIIGQLPNVTTLRLRMPMTSRSEPRNFINKIIKYSKVIDIPNSMTMIDDLVRCVDWMIQKQKVGIWHVTNPEPITAAQVMREWQKYKTDHKFEIITGAELDAMTIAKRSNCLLNTDKLLDAGFHMTPSEEAVRYCVRQVWNDDPDNRDINSKWNH